MYFILKFIQLSFSHKVHHQAIKPENIKQRKNVQPQNNKIIERKNFE